MAKREGTFDRTIARILRPGRDIRCNSACFHDGQIRRCISDGSRSHHGVRYNRLVRLAQRIKSSRYYGYGDRLVNNS